MKKTFKVAAALLILAIFITAFCGCNTKYWQNIILTPLCVHSSEQNLTVERNTAISIYRQSDGAGMAEISETFNVYNDGEETTIKLIYPTLLEGGENVDFRVNGEPSTDWWGAANANEVLEIRYSNKGIEKLNDGTYFNRAFPNWPELGEQIHNIDQAPEDNWITDLCGISYYVKEVTIPASGTVTVTASFGGDSASTIRFFRLADEIACSKHTLTVSVDPFSGFEEIGIEDQNVIDEMPDSNIWTAELDPAREDYFIKVES